MLKIQDARIVFAGTPDFAAAHLGALLESGLKPVAVYTQPDRPAGRGQHLHASPVKVLALTHGITVEQPLNFKREETIERLRAYQPDVMIVVAYGLLLPQDVLDIPRVGCVNVHGSLLPRWRGAAPIQRAIMAQDTETGIGLMQMEAGLDTGPVLAEIRVPIQTDDTGGSLHDKLATAGATLLTANVTALLTQSLKPLVQPDTGITYAKKLEKAESEVDWQQSASAIGAKIRAFNPWPVAQTHISEHTLRLWQAEPLNTFEHNAQAGTILAVHADAVLVACKEGGLWIHEAQLSGGKRLAMKDMLHAKRALFTVGTLLGAQR